jgi:hypothetical protein
VRHAVVVSPATIDATGYHEAVIVTENQSAANRTAETIRERVNDPVERREEIGVLRAVGFQRGHVLRMIFAEAAVLGVIGGLVGVGASGLVGLAVFEFMLDDPTALFRGRVYAGLGFAFGVLTGVVSGAYPAWSAANERPVDALRSRGADRWRPASPGGTSRRERGASPLPIEFVGAGAVRTRGRFGRGGGSDAGAVRTRWWFGRGGARDGGGLVPPPACEGRGAQRSDRRERSEHRSRLGRREVCGRGAVRSIRCARLQGRSHLSWGCRVVHTGLGAAGSFTPVLGLQGRSHRSWGCRVVHTGLGAAGSFTPVLGLQGRSHRSS